MNWLYLVSGVALLLVIGAFIVLVKLDEPLGNSSNFAENEMKWMAFSKTADALPWVKWQKTQIDLKNSSQEVVITKYFKAAYNVSIREVQLNLSSKDIWVLVGEKDAKTMLQLGWKRGQ